jgi:hypothetical protein
VENGSSFDLILPFHEAKVSQSGSLAKFETRTEITYTDSNTITLDTSVNTEGPISGSFNLKSPFNGFEELATIQGFDFSMTDQVCAMW